MDRKPGNGSLRIAGLIADGQPVDWEAAEKDLEFASISSGFRIMEAIASAHRKASQEAPQAGAPSRKDLERSGEQVRSRGGASGDGTPPGTHGAGNAIDAGGGRQVSASQVMTGPAPEPEGPDCPPFPWKWGHLEVRELLAQGGFGEVYRAYDGRLDREFALKLLRQDRNGHAGAGQSFILEARRHAQVDSDHVVAIHGADIHDNRAGMWMDLVEGRNLEQTLDRRGPYSASEAADIGIQMCKALAAVHKKGLIHRDVKTANIMRQEGGKYLLMDFSACIDLPDPGEVSGRTPTTGTVLFMAPEVLEGAQPNECADIYGLGVVLFRLVSGSFPVHAATLQEVVARHRRRQIRRLTELRPDLPDAFVRIVHEALSREPGSNCRTSGELQAALQSFVAPGPRQAAHPPEIEVPLPAPPPAPSTWVRLWRSHPARAAVSATLLFVLVGVAIVGPTRVLAGISSMTASLHQWAFGLSVDAQLFRQDPEGAQERLVPGARVRVRDALFLEIEGSREMHVYVINEDEGGSTTFLFPSGDFDLENPLPGRTRHTLPGTSDGEPFLWTITSAGGREKILVVASVDPVEDLENLRGRVTAVAAETGALAERSGDLRSGGSPPGTLRGMESARPAREIVPQPVAPGSLEDVLPGLADRAAGSAGLWTWTIELENPPGEGLPGS